MFANPLGLLALLAVPAVLGLHLFRRRYAPRAVGALFLWQEVGDAPASGRARQPLVRSASLWCELLVALFAALALAGPRPFAAELPHQVVVVDGSASMAAAEAGGESAWDRARAFLREHLDELPARARVTLVASAARPRTLAGPAAWRDEALAALEAYEPGAAHHDLAPTLDLARGLAGEADVLFVTDGRRGVGLGVTVRAFGTPLDNAGFVRARRTWAADGGERVDAAVAAYSVGPTARTARVVDARSGAVLASVPLDLGPGSERALTVELPSGTGAVRLELEPDALAVDDLVPLAPAVPRPVRVHVHGTQDVLAATLLAPPARVERVAPAVRLASDPAASDLVLDLSGTGGFAADAATWVLRAVPPVERTAWLGPFLVERSHPLLGGVALVGVAWVGDAGAALPGDPLVSAGEAALVSERRERGGREVLVNGDLAAGTFGRSQDWPILLSNLVEWRRDALPGPRDVNLVVGEDLWVGAPRGGDFALVGPSGRVERSGTGDLVFEGLASPGLYLLERDGLALAEVGVAFLDPTESDLRGLASGTWAGGGPRASTVGGGAGRLEWLLALLALVALAADQWVLARRGSAR